MCSIGRNQDQAVGAQAPQSTLLGAASIGGTAPRKRVVAPFGTVLTGTGSGGPVGTRPPPSGGGGGNPLTNLY